MFIVKIFQELHEGNLINSQEFKLKQAGAELSQARLN